jgi:hypothetical protein
LPENTQDRRRKFKPARAGTKSIFVAQVETGSRCEHATKQRTREFFRFDQIGKSYRQGSRLKPLDVRQD